jgi:glycosyltransferase involved in cell wall biosynthesis
VDSLRILHVITKLDVGGAQTVVAELVREQIKSGHTVTVATGIVWDNAEVSKIDGARVVIVQELVHPLAPAKDLATVRTLAHLIRTEQIHVVHTHSSKGGLLGRIAARRGGVPSVYTAHGWPFQDDAPRSQRIQSLIGEWLGGIVGNEIVCVNSSELQLAARWKVGSSKHRQVIHNGIAYQPAPSRPARDLKDPFNIVTIARLHPPKRIDLLIGAVAKLDPRVSLTIVGDGDQRASLDALVSKNGLPDRVRFVGFTDPTSALVSAHAFALASDYEGMPITILEAMRTGLPVVANDLPGIREAVGTDAGLLSEKSAEAIAAALRKVMDDPESCEKMGSAGRRRWEAEFTASASAARYEALYRSVLH